MYDNSIVESVDLDILKKPESNRFIDEIQSAHVYLTLEQSTPFFNIVLSHFDKDLAIDKGKEILHCLSKILSVEDFLKVFVKKNFAVSLPFLRKEYIDDLFDVLYVIVTRAPEAFDEELCACFHKRIKNRGEKSLLLITIYAQHFNEFDNPWPMLDLLFHCSSRFSKPDLAARYAALLSTLVQLYPEFRRGRGKEAWNTITDILSQVDDPPTLSSLYNSLCGISVWVKRCDFPFSVAKKHLKNPELAPSVLSLFLIIPLRGKELEDRVMVKFLLKMAASNGRATLVLFKLAENEGVATILAEDPIWLSSDIPQIVDTLRLLLVVFQHRDLRLVIAQSIEFSDFLQRLLDMKNESILGIVCVIIRRIDLTPELVKDLSNSSIIMNFINVAKQIGTNEAKRNILLLLDKIGKVAYTRELVQSCERITQMILDKGDLFEDATIVATGLCRYRRCAKKFSELYLVEFFTKLMKNRDYKKMATKFLKAVDQYGD
ncbi:hypothetical protein TRFO_16649 [Tritrichomonas foetus]|uniref:Uncharacterized protein n=1 Tax=Tritrichomonas foetus TaxID=1144522 RepID=A0A1J4KQ30_9EUKA|nr:hypothetical protein TRFO_16649 [Tritrichomonas foetus]|eukprot:OHT13218.1 hypothetical protein TRFO_16649 [Tritrichomonas foetus]